MRIMSREIKKNSTLRLHSGGEVKEFIIENIRGTGGSCVAYVVSFYESDNIRHRGILKEYCPAYLGEVVRSNDNSIVIPDESRTRFENGLNEFREAYRFINDYIAENEAAANYHPVQLGLFEGNNTLYTLSSYDYGKGYDVIKDNSIFSLIKLMISVTKAVEMYHRAGFVHCDIKPENIFILDDVTELIKLFDYDSLLSIDDLKCGKISAIPNPSTYYVPELADRIIRNIGISTDIFEIGAMLYYRLFGTAPKATQMERDSEFNFDEAPLMDGVSPKAKYEIQKLFKNTLQISVRRRYKTTKELLEQLNLILDNLDNKKPYLLNLPVWQPTRISIERNAELLDIQNRLLKDGFVFIKGMGGLGKSELSKMYVERFKSEYHTIQFCKYVDSLKALVAAMPISGINDEDYDNIDELYKAKNKILHQCDANTLIIVDNFNVTYDKQLRDFLPSDSNGFKVIFTTRCMPAADYYESNVLHLAPLSVEDSKRLFYLHNQAVKTISMDEQIENLVGEIQSNTLLLVLIAKMIKRTGIAIEDVILKLQEQELKSINTKVFYEYDYSDEDIEVYNKINNHLHIVFSISGLAYIEKQILLNMTLISVYGIQEEEFISACDECAISQELVNSLINQGWIENNNETISMHSIVSDVISEQNIEKEDSYYSLAGYLQDQCDVDETSHISLLQKALAIAKQLDRRYKTEDDKTQAFISYLLGNIYLSLYRPKEAERCLQRAIQKLKLSGCEADIPLVYNKLGQYEEKFGTKTKAIDYYDLAIKTARNLYDCTDSNEDLINDISEALLGIAECYESNNELEEAVQQYKILLHHINKYKLEFADGVIKDIIRLSEELGNQEDIDYYSSLLSNYETAPESEDESSYDEIIADHVASGDYSMARQEYEKMLSEAREELGEESPFYKDIAKYRWVYYLINNDTVEAERLIAENMSFIENTYGKNSMEMADFLATLSFQMIDNANFEYGVELAERAKAICEKMNQIQSYVYFKAKMDLISAIAALGDVYTAGELAEELDFRRFSGIDYLTDIIRSVGLVYLELGKYSEIIDLSNKVIHAKNTDRLSRVLAYEILLIYYERKGEINEATHYLNKIKGEINELKALDFATPYFVIYYRLSARINMRNKDDISAVKNIDLAISLIEDKLAYILLPCYQDRCVYNTNLNDYESATLDFERCNEIVEKYQLSPKVNLLIFNNVALIHYKRSEYSEAEKYYEMIMEIQPDIISSPNNYMEALICQNYGWIEYNLGNPEMAEKCILSAISFYESNGFTDSAENTSAKNNLSIVYANQGRFKENLSLLQDIYDKIDRVNGTDYTDQVYVSSGIVYGLLANEKEQEAYDFAVDEDNKFALKYGKKSIERIDYLQKVSGAFKYFGYLDAFEFLEKSRKLIKKAKLEYSVIQASQLNFVAVALWDLNGDLSNAMTLLNEAKILLENLGEQNSSLYELVCSNLKKGKDEQLNELIKKMAENMTDNS